MGVSSKPFHVALDLEGKEENLCETFPLLINPLEVQKSKQRRYKNNVCMARSRRISSRRNLLESSRRPVVTKRVKTLRKLVPSTNPVGLNGLFRDTADYIMALQLRVKVMHDLVDMLSGSDE